MISIDVLVLCEAKGSCLCSPGLRQDIEKKEAVPIYFPPVLSHCMPLTSCGVRCDKELCTIDFLFGVCFLV